MRMSDELDTKNRNLHSHEVRLLDVIISNVDSLVVVDSGNIIQFANRTALAVLGIDAGTIIGSRFPYNLDNSQTHEITITQNNTASIYEMSTVPIVWDAQSASLVSLRDITNRKGAEKTLRESEERYALAVHGSKDGLWDWNLTADTVHYSARWKTMLGYPEKEISTSSAEWFSRVHADDCAALKVAIEEHISGKTASFEFEYRLQHKDSSWHWMLAKALAVRNGGGVAVRMAGSQSDITERKEAERQLKKALSDLRLALASEKVLLDELDKKNKELMELSITDGLTGLYNHRFLQERFEYEFKRVKRYGGALSCMIIDIDHFKNVNDTYGHQAGDLVLREISRILKNNSRDVDICGRYGGEEFMIITNQKLEDTVRYATKLHAAVDKCDFVADNHHLHVTVSVGVAEYRSDLIHRQELIEHADVALYQAKQDGRNLIRIWKEHVATDELSMDRVSIDELKKQFVRLSSEVRATYMESTNALVNAIDAKDHYTRTHSQHVADYAIAVGRALKLPDADLDTLRYAALLHDVGKIGISHDILTKKEKLTDEEYDILKKHPFIGTTILKDVKFLEKEIPIILHHHEWYNGHGYPHGLKAREIPQGARILSVVDAFDAMTTDREYRSKMPVSSALTELHRGKGVQFDAEIVDVFVALIAEGSIRITD